MKKQEASTGKRADGTARKDAAGSALTPAGKKGRPATAGPDGPPAVDILPEGETPAMLNAAVRRWRDGDDA